MLFWLGLLLLVATGAWADPATHALPDQRRQLQQWIGDMHSAPYVVSGCAPSVPGASLTLPAFACEGYVRDTTTGELYYVTQGSQAVGPLNSGDGTYWVAIHQATSGTVAGWTRQAGGHYLWKLQATQPDDPPKGLVVAHVTVASGAITAVVTLRTGSQGCLSLAKYTGDIGARLNSALADIGTQTDCIDARMLMGARATATTVVVTKPVTLYLPGELWQYTGTGCMIDLQLGANDVQLVGLGQTLTVLQATGTSGTEKGVCTTVASTSSTNRGNRLMVRDLTLQGSASGATQGTAGTIGLDIDSFDKAMVTRVDVRNWGKGIRVQNPSPPGTGYYNQFTANGIFYNRTFGMEFSNGANSHSVLQGRIAGNGDNLRLDATQNIVVQAVTFEGAGGVVNTNISMVDAVSTTFFGNRFETGKDINITGTSKGTLFTGNYASSGHGDPINDTSTCNCTAILDTHSTLVTGGGVAGRTAPQGPIAGVSLIENGSFEYDFDNNGIAQGWLETGAGGGTYTWGVNAGGKCGSTYQRLQNTDHSFSRLQQEVEVDIGRPYIVSYWGAKNGNDGGVGIRIGTNISETAYTTIHTQGTDGVFRHVYSHVTPTTTTLRLTLISAGTTAVDAGWDCVSVVPGLLPQAYVEAGVFVSTLSLDPGSVTAQTTLDLTTSNVIGLRTSDVVVLNPPAAPTANVALVSAWISAANTLVTRWMNPTAGNIDPASQVYTIAIHRTR